MGRSLGKRGQELLGRVLAVTFLSMLGVAADTQAQTGGGVTGGPDPDGTAPPPTGPAAIGQWAGPWDLSALIDPVPGTWGEVVHMSTLGPPNDGKVLFWCRRDNLNVGVTQPTFLWDRATPNALTQIDVGNPFDGSYDIFCAGHTFAENGDLLVVGGTDMPGSVGLPKPIGTDTTYLFDNDALNPSWTRLADMDVKRYYPSAVRLEDGRILVGGDSGNTANDNTYEIADYSPQGLQVTWDPGTTAPRNYLTMGCAIPTLADEYRLDDYPRWDLLMTGDNQRVLRTYGIHSFFEFDVCPTQPDNNRFTPVDSPTATPADGGGNTAHFIYPDANGIAHEVIYAVGGSTAESCNVNVTNTVLTMTDPDLSVDWVDNPNFAMGSRRIDHTMVILLDGSMLVLNGYGPPLNSGPGDTCVGQRTPELFQPPEIFASPVLPTWQPMAMQAIDRTYHSLATLLPSGAVVSGGGLELLPGGCPPAPAACLSDEKSPSWHSLDVFNPPYMFRGRRPEITSVSTGLIKYGTPINITANLFEGDNTGEFRVALLGPGTSTHGFDFNQRYIKLNVTSFAPGTPATIQATAPTTGRQAPPGWYMLTVVNSKGLPSRAQWIQIGQ